MENDVLRFIYGGQQSVSEVSPIQVHINQFYGIEINDFAVAVAQAALWIAESQMMNATREIVQIDDDFLPLKSAAHIVEGNALRLDWNEIIPATELNYIMGNPPFVGARNKTTEQGNDLQFILGESWKNSGDIDYVGGWFKKAADFMKHQPLVKTAFVATNSICQGQQVANLWKPLVDEGVHIDFAWRTFLWNSEAADKAHVHCVIVGFSYVENSHRKLFCNTKNELTITESNVLNAYLLPTEDIFIYNRSTPLCDIPKIGMGNQPIDDGNYLFTDNEKNEFIKKEPLSEQFFKKWYGSDEFINQRPRWCLWLGEASPATLKLLPECQQRILAVKNYRSSSKRAATRKLANRPRNFQTENMPKGTSVLIPETSSERRNYIPMGFITPGVLCSNAVRLIPNASLYNFGVLTSSVHMAWVRVVCGRLEMRYRYSANLVYNNFPWPTVPDELKAKIEECAQKILDVRAKYHDCSLADLYDPNLMPEDLLKAHQANDRAVMKAYGFKSSMTESEIVAELFKLYQKKVDELAEAEAAQKAAKKPRKRKTATTAPTEPA